MPRCYWLLGPFLVLLATTSTSAVDGAELPARHQQWLDEVRPLLSRDERQAFLALDKDYQRDAFIAAFWVARDPRPATPENEFKERYYVLRDEAFERFGGWEDDRALVFVLNGQPAAVRATDCGVLTWPLELWTYGYSEHLGRGFQVLFYQRNGGGPFRLWHPAEGYEVLLPSLADREDRGSFQHILRVYCGEIEADVEALLAAIRTMEFEGGATASQATAPRLADLEWLLAFRSVSTDVLPEAPPLAASLAFRFPSRHQQRTVVEGMLEVPTAAAGRVQIGERAAYAFELTGEVLRGAELFESFRYQYELAADRVTSPAIPLAFERLLRPGIYTVIVKLADLGGGAAFREAREVTVPQLGTDLGKGVPEEVDAEVAAIVSATEDGASVRLASGSLDLQRGLVRFEATAEGEAISKVTFYLDERPVLTKTRPPYSVELDLGSLPRRHTVRVVALGAGGTELATDEIAVNAGEYAFRVRLVEPLAGGPTTGVVRARAEVEAPAGERVERVEFYRGADLVAALYQEPWVQPIDLAAGGAPFLRVAAYLEDGSSTEDLVLLQTGDFAETVEVRLVEVYATVLDGRGLPVHDLEPAEFRVFESERRQEVVRWERLQDLPLFAALLIDTSASMADYLPQVRQMAQRFLEETLRPRDRAAILTFSEKPRLAAGFTADLEPLAGALAGLHPEQGTALWDSLVFTVYHLRDLKGQRALIVLSDGADQRSDYAFDEALRYATASGVAVYVVALDASARGEARDRLRKLAETTGGRAFFLADIGELAAAYATLQEDLRSRYLLVYQAPPATDEAFRPIRVEVTRPGHEARAPQGYYP